MARTFNGAVENYFSTTLEYDLPTNATICFTAKTSDVASLLALMGRRGTSSGWSVYRLLADYLRITYFGAADNDSAAGAFPSDGAYHRYVITKSGTGVTFYRDSTTARGTATATYAAPSAGIAMYVGAYNNNNVVSNNFNGGLCEIALFSRVLDSTDIGQYMSYVAPTSYSTSLDHYWPMTETSGNCSASVGGVTLTQVGTVGTEDHPTGGGGGSATGAAAHYYRQLA